MELGAGASASASFLSDMGYHVTCLDISPLAKERFFKEYPDKVGKVAYITGDCLNLDESEEVVKSFESVVPPKWVTDILPMVCRPFFC